MDAVKKTIKRIRGQIRPKDPPASAQDILIADLISESGKRQMWERDKKTKRDQSFQKALLVRNNNLEQQRVEREAEAERQGIIAEARLKNLKKARRRQRWLKKQEQE